jgi:hypothetical protein
LNGELRLRCRRLRRRHGCGGRCRLRERRPARKRLQPLGHLPARENDVALGERGAHDTVQHLHGLATAPDLFGDPGAERSGFTGQRNHVAPDARVVAEAVASALGIDRVLAEVLPDQKAAKIQELQQAGKRVAMVGDGVNDAPALATADVGIAIGAETDVAVEAGDIVLVRSDPRDVPKIISLSRATYRKMIQNLWWAAGYNIVAIPLAAGVLSKFGILLSPACGAVLMSVSTIVVAINASAFRVESDGHQTAAVA